MIEINNIKRMGLLNLLGLGNKTNYIKDFIERGAVIIDVRTVSEYASGHIKGSKNIPLDKIQGKLQEIKKAGKPIIACCRSGMRSSQATHFLKSNGIECLNGGSWNSLERKL